MENTMENKMSLRDYYNILVYTCKLCEENSDNEQAMEMLEAVGLADRANHKPFEMSGGQQQRVSIARAFVNRPPVVFADEPTGNLDTKTTYEMMDLITGMAQKNHQTLVIVTHDQELAEYADRIVVLQDGKIEKIQKRIREKKENVYE